MCDDKISDKELSFEPIRLTELALDSKKKAWLKRYGWEYRCDFIDAGWRWCKKIENKLMMCDMNEAINLEYNYLSEVEQPAMCKHRLEHSIEIVQEDLAFCKVCKGAEGTLTTECCGRPLTAEEEEHVYAIGDLDFYNGAWQNIEKET